MLTIYSSSAHAKRLFFVAGHLFNNLLGTDFQIFSDKKRYLEQKGPCINYSNEDLKHGLQIFPHGLLAETGVRRLTDLHESEWQGRFCFFYHGKGDIPFDLFAASFYLLTLYGEYFPEKLDEHGRFRHQESLLFQKNLLETPMVDYWAHRLKTELANAGFDTSCFRGRKFRAISTYDIDHPYLYRYKGWIKNTGNMFRECLKGDWQPVLERLLVYLCRKEDPYMQAIRWIYAFHKRHKRPFYLFVLLGGKGKYGRSTFYQPNDYYHYLKKMDSAQTGLHPSYQTLGNEIALKKEKNKLEKLMQQPITLSRQHFLRMQTPDTFRDLVSAGFTEDFTLAFAHAPGFRSGTTVPHFFYDLQKDETSALLIRPTVMMDSSFIFHSKLSPEEALQKMKKLINTCKQAGGDYLSLWHNSNLAGAPEKNPWINVFIESSEYAIYEENH